jgi:carboxylate-amine ligase
VPRAFHDVAEYEEVVAASVAAAGAEDYTFLWWDIRPHPRLGTVEVREMDAQSSLRDVGALAGLVHALAVMEAQRPPGGEPPPAEAIGWSSFRAARDGLEARIYHDGAFRSVTEAARDALARVRPFAAELCTDTALEGVERILREGGGAARQRAAHARGGMPALLAELVRATD